MITYVKGDLFESPAKVLVNTVNTVGVMGKGIAKTFKEVYPEMFREYQGFCRDGSLTVGKLWLYKTPHKWILNFPTKQHWRGKSRLEYIEAGLDKFAATYDRKLLLQVSFPMLGCGNGELDWDDVRPLMEQYLRPLPIDVYIHLYPQSKDFVPEHRDVEAMKQWLQSEPRSLPFEEFWEDLLGLAHAGRWLLSNELENGFRLEALTFDDSLRILCGRDEWKLSKVQLSTVWDFVRANGYFSRHHLPSHWQHLAPYIMALLRQLPYVSEVMISGLETGPNFAPGLLNTWPRRRHIMRQMDRLSA